MKIGLNYLKTSRFKEKSMYFRFEKNAIETVLKLVIKLFRGAFFDR